MTRRKLIAAAFVFTLFGAAATMPPLILLFRLDGRVLGAPIEMVYIFALWTVLVIGTRWLSRVLPDDRSRDGAREDDRP